MSNITVKNPLLVINTAEETSSNNSLGVLNANSNTTYYAVQDGYYGYSQVNVNVTPNLGYKYITSSGTYYPNNDGYDGYNEVYVDVQSSSPSYSTRSISDRITSNGYYHYSPTSYGGDVLFDYIGITVSVASAQLGTVAYSQANSFGIEYYDGSYDIALKIADSARYDSSIDHFKCFTREIAPYFMKGDAYHYYINEYDISGDIDYIGKEAFCNTILQSFSNNGHTINCVGRRAFANNTMLSTVYLNARVISDDCFIACSILSSLTLGSDLKYIGPCVFEDCNSLTDITYSGNCDDWVAIDKDSDWARHSYISTIYCDDGFVDVNGNITYDWENEEPDPEEDPGEEPEE